MVLVLGVSGMAYAQNSIKVTIKDFLTDEIIPGAKAFFPEEQDLENPTSIYANESGVLTFDKKGHKKITFQALGYSPLTYKTNIVPDIVYLKSKSIYLDDVTITAQYKVTESEDAVHRVKLIDVKTIESKGAVNLRELLNTESNFRLSQDNILGSSTSVQGLSGQNVKIMVDGVPVIGRVNGNVDISQINLNEIARIEIIEGPMSVEYGSNALAGTINLITKKKQKEDLTIGLNSYYETVGQYNLNGKIGLKRKDNLFTLSAGRNYFDGWSDNDDFTLLPEERVADIYRVSQWKPKEQYFARGFFKTRVGKTNIALQSQYFDEKITNRGTPRGPLYISAFDEYYTTERLDNSLNLDHDFTEDKKWTSTLAYNYYQRIKEVYVKDLTTLEEILTPDESDDDKSTFKLFMARGQYINARSDHKLSMALGYDINFETGEGRRIEDGKQEILDAAVFVNSEYKPNEDWVVRPGLRYAYNSAYDAPLTPSVHVKYNRDRYNYRISYARGFRAPSVKDLYFYFVDINHNIVGNPDLKAEYSNNISFGIDGYRQINKNRLKTAISGYYNDIQNLIRLAQGEGTQFTYVNLANYNSIGWNADAEWRIPKFTFGLGYGHIGINNRLNEDTPYKFSPEVRSTLEYFIPKSNTKFSVFYKYTGKQVSVALDENDQILENTLDAYHTMDATCARTFWENQLNLSVGVKNLFDVTNVNSAVSSGVHSTGSGTSPVSWGRSYFVSAAFNIGIKTKSK